MKERQPLVQSEAELCAAFIDEFNRVPGWTCYPETAGFDIPLPPGVTDCWISV